MENNKLICPVERLNKSDTNVDIKVDFQDDQMNIKADITTKNIVKTVTDFINKKFSRGNKNE